MSLNHQIIALDTLTKQHQHYLVVHQVALLNILTFIVMLSVSGIGKVLFWIKTSLIFLSTLGQGFRWLYSCEILPKDVLPRYELRLI